MDVVDRRNPLHVGAIRGGAINQPAQLVYKSIDLRDSSRRRLSLHELDGPRGGFCPQWQQLPGDRVCQIFLKVVDHEVPIVQNTCLHEMVDELAQVGRIKMGYLVPIIDQDLQIDPQTLSINSGWKQLVVLHLLQSILSRQRSIRLTAILGVKDWFVSFLQCRLQGQLPRVDDHQHGDLVAVLHARLVVDLNSRQHR